MARDGRLQYDHDEIAPVVEWEDFTNYVFDWHQDQHVGLIGPTDSGKSTLIHGILPMRKYVTFFGTKVKDRTLDAYINAGDFTRIKDWPPKTKGPFKRALSADEMPRRLLWPDVNSLDAVRKLAPIYEKAISDIYGQGCWCAVFDEFWMMSEILKLREDAKIFLQQARSNDISLVMGMQRPSWIPPEAFDQSSHLFFWRDNDEVNLKRIGNVGWLAAGPIREIVASLDRYQVLYVNTRTGHMYRTTAPELKV